MTKSITAAAEIDSNSYLKLIYAHDTLCGWCYGFIPALRHFVGQYPGIDVEIVPGGLMTGTPSRAYSTMSEYIKGAEVRLKQVTGRKPSAAFHALIAQENGPDAASEKPANAVLQMKKLAPGRALEFSHLLQEAHFGAGKDVNDPQTYDDLCKRHDFPRLDTRAITNATLADPLVSESIARCRKLGPNGYPTVFLTNQDDVVLSVIPSIYDPSAFVSEFTRIRDASG